MKCEACRAFIAFRNKFDKFNKTGVRMLDSIYHMTLKLLCNHKNLIFGMKKIGFCRIIRYVVKSVIS